jgi:hypothetical protein
MSDIISGKFIIPLAKIDGKKKRQGLSPEVLQAKRVEAAKRAREGRMNYEFWIYLDLQNSKDTKIYRTKINEINLLTAKNRMHLTGPFKFKTSAEKHLNKLLNDAIASLRAVRYEMRAKYYQFDQE